MFRSKSEKAPAKTPAPAAPPPGSKWPGPPPPGATTAGAGPSSGAPATVGQRTSSGKALSKTASQDGGDPQASGGFFRSLTSGKKKEGGMSRENSGRGMKREGSNRNKEKSITPHRVEKTNHEWRKALPRPQYVILRKRLMEKPYTGKYVDYLPPADKEAIFFCMACDTPVFSGKEKVQSENGWASFGKPIPGAITQKYAEVNGLNRLEIVCNGCDGFLGLVNRNMDVNSEVLQLREISKDDYKMLFN
mmetsp:Transcript_3813/g.6859  ORF Transcript_3813/g.6859 Transcript_3813/m.6859 type:complete len:248 (+) Transcript_3813:177-920(+)